MPTLAELCKIDLDTKELDGESLVPVIMDEKAKSRHESGFCWQSGKKWAARKGDWKLLGNAVGGKNRIPADSIFLVNLKDDQGEMTNLVSKYPEKVKELKIQFERWLERNE